MNLLRTLGRSIVIATWLFNMIVIRLIVLLEVFVFIISVCMWSNSGLGPTFGDNIVYQPYHRGIFLLALPLVCAIGGTIFGQLVRRIETAKRNRLTGNYFLTMALVNVALFLFMASAWPESVVAGPVPSIIAALLMSAMSTMLSIFLCSTPFERPPFNEQ
jgi:hypothetical protein